MPEPISPGGAPADPKAHAAQLLDQADRLVQLARELRREARRLNGSLGLPEHRPLEPIDPSVASPADAPPVRQDAGEPSERRFASAAERMEAARREIERQADELEISDGARLLITGMAITGSSREEILEWMHDEFGLDLENADAILERLSV